MSHHLQQNAALANIPYCFCREVSRDREKKRDQEDEEEAYERRKLERKLRDKEAAYREVRNGGRTPELHLLSLGFVVAPPH